MSKTEKLNEEQVFKQEVSDDELEAVAGGREFDDPIPEDWDSSQYYCINNHYRRIYDGKQFPMCAASVEDGSWCETNDACYQDAIVYWGMSVCKKAWH